MSGIYRVIILLICNLLFLSISHANYPPPFEHYKQYYLSPDAKEIWKFSADINQDGKDEVFLTQDNARNAKAGQMWSVYRWVPAGHYSQQAGIRSFRTDAFYVGSIPEFNEYGLLTYHPAGGGNGALILLKYTEMVVIEKKLKILNPRKNPADAALYNKYFKNSNYEKVQKIKVKPGKVEVKIDKSIPYLDLEIFMKGLEYSNKMVPESIRNNNPSKSFIEKWTTEARQGEPVIYEDYNQDGYEDIRFELKYARGATGNKTFLLFTGTKTGYVYAGMMSVPVHVFHYPATKNTYFIEYSKNGPEGYYALTKMGKNELKSIGYITFNRFVNNSFPEIPDGITENELLGRFKKND